MADPVTLGLAGVSLASTVAGAGISAYGKEQQGQAEAAKANYQAGVARINAQLAKQDANYTLEAGGVQAQQAGMQERFKLGATRAGFGASNIAGASQNRVLASETEVGQQQQGIISANAAKRAYGFEVGAAQDVTQAGALDIAAQTSKTAGDIGAVSSIIGGVGSVSSKWLQMGPAFGKPGGVPPQATDPTYSSYGFNVS